MKETPPRLLYIGRVTLDVLYLLKQFPEEDTKVYAQELRYAPGGPALNAAITDALLGGHPLLIGAVGRGPWAEAVRTELNRRVISLLDLAEGTAFETPLCTAWMNADTSSRTIANPPISVIPLKQLAETWRETVPESWGVVPPIVLADGFHLRETLPLLRTCKAAGAAICLDGGSWKPNTEELVPLLTAAICSERFSLPNQPSDPETVLAWFAAQGVPHVAITRGAQPILVLDRGRRFEIAIEPIEAKDTLGAGDVLHGAFCHHFAQHKNFEAALRFAAQIATQACKSTGIAAWAEKSYSVSPQ